MVSTHGSPSAGRTAGRSRGRLPDRRAAGREPTTILITHQQALFRRGISSILEREPDFALAGEAADSHSAVEKANETAPDQSLRQRSHAGRCVRDPPGLDQAVRGLIRQIQRCRDGHAGVARVWVSGARWAGARRPRRQSSNRGRPPRPHRVETPAGQIGQGPLSGAATPRRPPPSCRRHELDHEPRQCRAAAVRLEPESVFARRPDVRCAGQARGR